MLRTLSKVKKSRMEHVKRLLVKKGWSSREIEKTIRILGNAQHKKSKTILFLDQAAIWIGLLLVILGNFIVSVVLVPFLIIMSGFWLYLTLLLIAMSFGFVVSVIAEYLEKIQKEHLLIMGILLPAIALINVYIMTHFSNRLEILMQVGTQHSPALVALTYTVGFMIPYVISRIKHF